MSELDFETRIHAVAAWIANTRPGVTRYEVFCEIMEDDCDLSDMLDNAANVLWRQ